MPELFNRHCSVTIGQPGSLGLQFTRTKGGGHHIGLDIQKNATSAADKGEIRIYGLSEVSRNRIEQVEKQAIIVDAGYVETHGIIFQGKVDQAWSEKENGRIVTIVKATDFVEEMSKRILAIELKDESNPKTIINQLAGQLGIKIGALTLQGLKMPKGQTLPMYDGFRKVMNEICWNLGLYWHITDSKLFVAGLGQATQQKVIRLSSSSGLIESPERGTAGIKGTALLLHELQPGVTLQVARADGKSADDVIATKVNFKGATFGKPYYALFESLYRKKVVA